MIYRTAKFTIYFGGSQDDIDESIDCEPSSIPLIEHKKYAPIAKMLAIEHLAFLNQTHGKDGMIIKDKIPAFEIDGDYLIAKKQNTGIGVLTADCLPIALYDSQNHAGAIVHAGWRSTVARIAQVTISQMQNEIGSEIDNLQIFFGPSAKICCYEVTGEFLAHLKHFSYADSVIRKVGNKLYLDVPLLNVLQLQEIGVQKSAISFEYNFCTICDDRFFSYRRQNKSAGRQMSIISLR